MEITIVLFILGLAVTLFVTEKYPVDQVALIVLGILMLITVLAGRIPGLDQDRWISLNGCLSGFSNPAVITVLAMFVLSAGLEKTGAVSAIGHTLIRLGKKPKVLMLLMMISVGAISAFINNTAAVAVFLPLVLTAASRSKISSSKLLIPLSFASQFGGVCTLMGTSTNLIVSAISEEAGYGSFSVFEFSKLGLIMVVAGILYLILVERWLLPAHRGGQLVEEYQLRKYIAELRVGKNSALLSKTIQESELAKPGIQVLKIMRGKQNIWPGVSTLLQVGDVLLVEGRLERLMEVKDGMKLEMAPEFELKDEMLQSDEFTLVEVIVPPRSPLLGRTLADMAFARRYHAIVLAIHRRRRVRHENLVEMRLHVGDVLLVQGTGEDIDRLRRDRDFIVMREHESGSLRKGRAPVALAIIAAVVLLAVSGIMPILVSSVLGCVAMLLTRCLRLEEVYGAVDWKVITLLIGILPLGLVMEKSGVAEVIVDYSLGWVGGLGPVAVLAMLYFLTAALTETMSNNAAAVFMAPIAIFSAVKMGVDPRPLLMAVTFAASTSFATPIGYQTNTMVYSAGNYKFFDFIKVGVPLNLIFWCIAIYFIPIIWPF